MNHQKEVPRYAKYIVTRTGKLFRPLDPSADDLDIIDIAAALGKICRYTGHVRHFYSVAQHSVLVSEHVPKELALQGLMHDAQEAYMTDVNSPVKSVLEDYKIYERQLERTILRKFCGVSTLDPAVKKADLEALATETRDLMPRSDLFFLKDQDIQAWPEPINPWGPEQATHIFLRRYCELAGKESEYYAMLGYLV